MCVFQCFKKNRGSKTALKKKNLTKNKQSDCSCIKHSPRIISAPPNHTSVQSESPVRTKKLYNILTLDVTPIFHCNCTKRALCGRVGTSLFLTSLGCVYVTCKHSTTRVEKGSNKNITKQTTTREAQFLR